MNDQLKPSLHQRILDNLSAAALLFDQGLILRYVNPAGEVLFADSARHLIGLSAANVFKGPNKKIIRDLVHCLQTGESLAERSLVLKFPENPVTVNIIATPLVEEAKPTEILVELQQVDRHLRISREEQLLMQQNTARMLVRGLAHEIKNPLGGVRGAAQLLERELDNEELREYTQIIIAESDRLQSLMDRMLGPSRLPQKTAINIHEILERVRQLVQVETPPGVTIKRDYDPSIPVLQADQDQLIQAVLNIVRNAAQAVRDQGEIILRTRVVRQMTIGRQRYKLAVKIEVIDDGPGIKPELLSQIFYPMITGRAEGTGLGLSIAQSLINQHDGLIECSSSPKQTVFSIYLPLER